MSANPDIFSKICAALARRTNLVYTRNEHGLHVESDDLMFKITANSEYCFFEEP